MNLAKIQLTCDQPCQGLPGIKTDSARDKELAWQWLRTANPTK